VVKRAKNFWNRFLDYIGLNESHALQNSNSETFPKLNAFNQHTKPAKVINIHQNKNYKFMVTQPKTFRDVIGVADQLKNRNAVIVSLNKMDIDEARRFIDFLSGVVYSIEGEIRKIEKGIFLIVPSNIDVSWELEEKLKKQGFPWEE